MTSINGPSPFARFDLPSPLRSIDDPRLSKSITKIFIDFFSTKDFPKLFNYGIQWIGRITIISPELRSVGVFAGNVKNFMSMTKIYASCVAVHSAVNKLWQKYWDDASQNGELRDAALGVMRETSSLSNDVCDTIKLGGQFFQIPYMPCVDAVAAVWTFFGSVSNFTQDMIQSQTAVTTHEKILSGLALGMDMSYMMVGGLGIYAFVMSAPVSIILVPLTTALVCSLGTFWEKERAKLDPAYTQTALDWSLRQLTPLSP